MEYILILFVTFTLCGGNENAFSQFEDLGQFYNSLNFVYYRSTIRWSAARAVCKSLGGDLASIDSDIIRDYIVWKAQENYGYNIFTKDYWVGLVELNANEHFWVADCKNLSVTTHYTKTFNPDKQCTRHRQDHSGEHRDCTQADAFLCQVPSSGPCDAVGVIDSEVLAVKQGITECESLCLNDPKCWAAIQYVPNNCVQLAVPGHGIDGFSMKSKFCFNVTLNLTAVDDDQSNSFKTPNASCGDFSYIQPSSTNASLVTSLGLPVCDTVTLTTNLTIIEMTTETTTKISIKPTTEVSTKTTTEMINSTTIEISTKMVTAPAVTATITQNITVTASAATATLTQNITVTAFVTATQTQNITFEQVEEVAAEIVKNLTIDVKSTSSHKRRLTSAEDKRQSSKFVGYIGIIFVTAPLALMVITDVRKLFVDFHTYSNFRKKD